MKYKYFNLKYILNIFLMGSILVLCKQSISCNQKTNQIIQINANQQIIDIKNNTITFTEKVIIQYGSINIHADSITITKYKKNQNKFNIIKGKGTPITLCQTLNNNQKIHVESSNIHYNTSTNIIKLINNVSIKQSNNYIQGDYIHYSIDKHHIEIFSNPGKKVITKIQLDKPNT